ncbi:serine/threonine-protein kinase [Bythopirellula goksoeyrii]|uniref:Serine/threonine-protein kinase PknB n=1 Tax=Bythopirellula goksoeyrii TaxID=1400387 RepID=A0A5B9Q5Z8_9BACT|nr:serine/threonine-protein kinase [Bythopirellula goksoeyrii]QEG34417.1 Serine/threonine-protein kinase PknB [Bythopirellula goksoeyrii]
MHSNNSGLASAKSIYFSAIEIEDEAQCAKYLDDACQGDDQLRQEAEQLLAAHGATREGVISRAVAELNPNVEHTSPNSKILSAAVASDAWDVSQHPVIGRYKLLEEIGRGGMGTVYMAQQTEPIKRRVALKLINPGMDSREVIARFEAERQALAMMDHPNIARVLDAGTTEQGHPYFVMELVRGIPITEYCQQHRLTIEERLRLIVDVCHAVQHAHQKGIIHRDLKPSNVMVTGSEGVPAIKVIDFGVAKALHQDLTDKTLFTQFSQLIGTPLYVSPEQAGLGNLDVDTRSDIYSLGVLLYELLTGTTPFDRETLAKAGIDDARKIIREQEPLRPSARLSTLRAANDSTTRMPVASENRRLVTKLQSELDWIAMRALEKERGRRYQTASDLAEDIERYFNNEPIEAKPPTFASWLGKWSRRHAALVWTLLCISLVSATALGISNFSISASRNEAVRHSEQAELERQKAEQLQLAAIEQKNIAHKNQYYAEMVAGQFQTDSGNAGGLIDNLIKYLPLPQTQDIRGWEWYYLLSKCRPEERTIVYPGLTPFVAWSPDGKFIAAPGAVWEADSGKCIRRFDTSYIMRYRSAWSPDGEQLAWGMTEDENAYYIWERNSNRVSRYACDARVNTVAWSPEGSLIAVGLIGVMKTREAGMELRHRIEVRDAVSQQLRYELPGFDSDVSLAWSPDGRFLAAGYDWGGDLEIWDVSKRERVKTLGLPGIAVCVSWHPRGNQLAVSEDDRWRLFDTKNWEQVYESGRGRYGEAISFSPDGALIAVSQGEAVAILDSSKKTRIVELQGHRYPVHSLSWHPDSRRLVSGGESTEIKLWDLDRERPAMIATEDDIETITWQDADQILTVVDPAGRSTALWNVRNGANSSRHLMSPEDPIAVSADRTRAAIHDDGDKISILDVATGTPCASIPVDSQRHFHTVSCSPDGSTVLVQTEAERVLRLEVWNVDQERLLWTWESKRASRNASGPLNRVTWNTDGTRFAAIGFGDDGENGSKYWRDHLHLFDIPQKSRLFKYLPNGRDKIISACWDANGGRIAIGTADGRLEVVDAEHSVQLFSEKIHVDGITAIAWHPTGKRLALGTRDGTVKIADSEAGTVLLNFPPLSTRISSMAWSANGQELAAASARGEIQSWDARRGYELASGSTRRGELAWAYYGQSPKAASESRTDALQAFMKYAPDTLGYWRSRGEVCAELGNFKRAREEFSKAIGSDLKYSFSAARARAWAILGSGRWGDFHQTCAELVQEFQHSPIPSNQGYVSWLWAMTPNELIDPETVVQMAHTYRDEYQGDRAHLTYGACLYRKGDLDEAVRVLMSLSAKLDRGGDQVDLYHSACANYFLAMSRYSLGNEFQARRLCQEANQFTDACLTRLPSTAWQQRVALQTLRQEANAMLAD